MDKQLLRTMVFLAKQAGRATLPYFKQEKHLSVSYKKDHNDRSSPVTAADLMANRIITSGLSLASDYPILSEENKISSFEKRQTWSRYWLIDPLDGTKGFIQQLPEYTVNIALIENHRPILGVVYLPVTEECYFGQPGLGAFKQQGESEPVDIHVRSAPKAPLDVLVGYFDHSKPLSSLLSLLQEQTDYHLIRLNSSMKFCRVAEGLADAYVRLGPTSEWDTAAGQAVLEAAGGLVVDTEGLVLSYNQKADLINPHFCAVINRDIMPGLLADIRRVKALDESHRRNIDVKGG